MPNHAAILQCPNYFCQRLNAEGDRFCSNCQTLLPKRYLWAVGVGLQEHQPGDLIGDRYLLKHDRVVLDTKPGNPIEIPQDVTPSLEPYLRLIVVRSQVPQIYGMTKSGSVLLLEDAPIYPDGADEVGTLMPALSDVWDTSTPIRQLNWLWQIAQLWQLMSSEKVATTLLTPVLVRVDGGRIRVLELEYDSEPKSLADLGAVWGQWRSHPDLGDFFPQLCQNLTQGQIQTPEQLIAILDQALKSQAPSQTRQVKVATASDQGPSRTENEDAYYPPDGKTSDSNRLIVCDGIGGQDCGEIASWLAIETLSKTDIPQGDPATVTQALEEAVCFANNIISERNDLEKRQERQRMGTTVVMGYVQEHELYITHVGDSRAYRITRSSCDQITLDDDVASREARLGYALYREALQHPSAGALVQALGMSGSNYLHPTVQRFVLDEDCVYLLCSDGLSDNDRIEECWKTDIAPILDGKLDLAIAAQKLVEIANTKNGHDNVTIGLIHCSIKNQVRKTPQIPVSLLKPPATQMVTPATPATSEPRPASPALSTLKTQLVESSNRWTILIPILGLLGIGALMLFWIVPEIFRAQNPGGGPSPQPVMPSPSPTGAATSSPTIAPPPTDAAFPIGSYVQVKPIEANATPNPISLLKTTEVSLNQSIGRLPPGSVLQVQTVTQPAGEAQGKWVQFKVCSVTNAPGVPDTVQRGEVGWQREKAIAPLLAGNISLKPEQLGACAPNSPTP
jgi:protein phosphatase